MSLRMLAAAGASAGDSVLDVGGGASPLAGALLHRGFADVTLLDVSAAGIGQARERLGPEAGRVRWLTADILMTSARVALVTRPARPGGLAWCGGSRISSPRAWRRIGRRDRLTVNWQPADALAGRPGEDGLLPGDAQQAG
jgi:hypothetical protein